MIAVLGPLIAILVIIIISRKFESEFFYCPGCGISLPRDFSGMCPGWGEDPGGPPPCQVRHYPGPRN